MPQTTTTQNETPFFWVHLGTNIPCHIEESSLFDKKFNTETGEVEQGLLLHIESGKAIRLEKISEDAFEKRSHFFAEHVWLISDSFEEYDAIVDLRQLINIQLFNGLISSGDILTPDGQYIKLRLMHKVDLYKIQAMHALTWVYAGTSEVYPYPINKNNLSVINTDLFLQAKLKLDNGETILLDYISTTLLNVRNRHGKMVWVEKDDSVIVAYPKNAKIIKEVKNRR